MSIENELQGMVVASVEIPTPTGNKPSHIAIPAVHLEKLVSDYRKLAASPPTTHEASATRRPRLSTSEATNDSTTERSPDSPPPYQEFAKKLATMNSSVADAEELLVVAERDAGNGVVVDTVPRARRRLDEAIRNRKAIQDEYAAVLRDLELQVESAQLEADAAKNNFERHVELSKNHAATRNELDATKRRLKQAALALERLKVRFALYKKAGEGTAGDAQTKTWTSGKPLPSTMSSGF